MQFLNNLYSPLRNLALNYIYKDAIKLYWFDHTINFGDVINPLLVQELSGKKIYWVSPERYKYNHLLSIGSVLSRATRNSIVWGSGFISEHSVCKEKPQKVYAVRGPLSRELLLKQGIECPKVYGDPALLLPLLYKSQNNKKYKIGLIAHYADKNHPVVKKLITNEGVHFIDVQSKNPLDFIDQINSCDKVISSSLHGLIVADAYGIPSLWVEFSDKVIGNGFKFYDYFLSVGRQKEKPIRIVKGTTIKEIESKNFNLEIKADINSLLAAAPFAMRKISE